MLDAVTVDSLCAVELVPVFVRQLGAVVAGPAIRVPHLGDWSVFAHESLVIIGKPVGHKLIAKRSLSRPHHAELKCPIL